LSPSDSRCLVDTRQELLGDIETWLQSVGDVTAPSIYWLTGVAGCGKSTVSRTVIDRAKDLNLPCSWFCFSRDYPDRRSPDKLMTTVALDLISTGDSLFIHEIHNAVTKGIDGSRPLLDQMEGFLRGPLAAAPQSSQPVVLVWDALDECSDSRATLIALLNLLHTLPQSTRIFLTSRLEDDLDTARNSLMKKTSVQHHDLTFHKDQSDDTLHDIDIFMRASLKQISAGRSDWPGEDALKALNCIPDGLFMIAEFICRFLDHPQKDRRLKSLLHEGSFDHGGTTIDKLYSWYRTGLHHIFRDDTTQELEHAKIVMATILVVQCPLSGSALANFIKLDKLVVWGILERLSPFLEGGSAAAMEHQTYPIRFVHKSMSDFLVFDNVSTTITALQMGVVFARAHLASCCLEILTDRVSDALRWISSSLPSPEAVREGEQKLQLPRELEALEYACQFWGYHLKDIAEMNNSLETLINNLFFSHLLGWLHLMGHLDMLHSALSCLHLAISWKVGLLLILHC
jgi:hypothetical protein